MNTQVTVNPTGRRGAFTLLAGITSLALLGWAGSSSGCVLDEDPIPAGTLGGACLPGGGCDVGLACVSGECVAEPTCEAGWTRPCNCPGGQEGNQTCEAGGAWGACACELDCDPGFADCDGDPGNGCETPLGTVTDCGACDDACDDTGGTPSCASGVCAIDCEPGFVDCDQDAANGCETALGTLSDCTACGDSCGGTHAQASCGPEGCALSCDQGFEDCDEDPSNGCEADLSSAATCGSCDFACGDANGSASCDGVACQLACDPGFADCDQDPSNGCEADLGQNPHCGSCFHLCAGACAAGQCEACDSGLALDSANPADAAKAMGLCDGVVSASWVLPDGTLPPVTNFDIGHGLLSSFGPNVSPQEGSRLLVLSSGTARAPTDPGYQPPSGFSKSFLSGHPAGFPKESPSCPGIVTGQPHDGAGLQVELTVPPGAQGLAFRFSFYTYDWPAYVCSAFNDLFVSLVHPIPAGLTDGNLSFDDLGNPISVNSALLRACDSITCPLGTTPLVGTGFGADTEGQDHGATGWVVTRAPVTPGSTITLRFAIYDSGDGVLDSTVLIDGFHWIAAPTPLVTEPAPAE